MVFSPIFLYQLILFEEFQSKFIGFDKYNLKNRGELWNERCVKGVQEPEVETSVINFDIHI